MNEKLLKILNNPLTVPVAVGAFSFASGVGLGYILGRRQKFEPHDTPAQLEFDFDVSKIREPNNHDEELAEVRRKVMAIREARLKREAGIEEEEDQKDQKLEEPEESDTVRDFVSGKLQERVVETLLHNPPDLDPAEEVVAKNVFAEDDDDWDYDEEVKSRSSSEPYILHKDEFWNNELDYSQITLTYYEGDDIMADEDDSPVYNYKETTGPLRWGHGSGDPNVVYIRNDKRKAEYEVVRMPDLYSVEVLGLEIENNERVKDLKHSDNRKFRLE